MKKPLFEDLLNKVKQELSVNPDSEVMDVVFDLVNFTDRVPDVESFLNEDASLAVMDLSGGHNCINYPDDESIENIVITNLQERLAASFE